MPNGYEVIWSPRAKTDLENKIEWLLENWSEKEVRQFVRSVDERIALVQTNPKLFPTTRKKSQVRKSVMKYHTTIYYQLRKNTIYILTLFDPRQHPGKRRI